MTISIRRPGFGGYARSVTGASFMVVIDDVSKGVALFFASSAAVHRCVRSLLSILVEVWAQSKVLGDRLKCVLSLFLAPELIKVHKYCLAAIAAPMKFEESP